MVSIGHYVIADSQTEDTLNRTVKLLLKGLQQHCRDGDPEEVARLHESIHPLLAMLERRTPADELIGSATHVVDALGHYQQHVAEYFQRPISDLQLKVDMLTNAITAISGSSSDNIRRLREVKDQMLSSSTVKDIRSLRMLLSECVDGVLVEAERQRHKTDEAGEQLNRSLSSSTPTRHPAATDPTTGFPIRARAEEIITEACESETSAFAVVMVVGNIQNINRSLGREIGDLMLQRFAAYLREKLPAVDQLFRWSGPAVVAMMRRRSLLTVRGVIEPLLIERLTVRTGTTDVQVPITTRWTVLPLSSPPNQLFQKIDSFADSE